ncbi:MAG: DUF2203 family protein [Candidatus Aenigmarchaeota archaeon]|nr:DUF2203 family protein [Candidatus Aenigmarchaeota archaeon]
METKIFTVQEANKALPKIISHFNEIDTLKKKIFLMNAQADSIKSFWGAELRDSDNPDSQNYDNLRSLIEEFRTDILTRIERIQEFGCIIKDIDDGIIDFYSVKNGELVLLCWKYGEKDVRYWHPVESGYRARRLIEEVE